MESTLPRSIIGWFVVCWGAFLVASVVVGTLLLSLYAQSTPTNCDDVGRYRHGCDAVTARYQSFATTECERRRSRDPDFR